MNKRGELTSQQIILIILALAGFAIILYFLVSLNIEGKGEDQACKLAILARAQVSSGIPFLKESLPLACKTKKTCITGADGKCEENFAGEKYDLIKVDEDEAKESIEKVLASEYVKCWDTVGRGNLQVFGTLSKDQLGVGVAEPKCMICARIAVDDISQETLRQVKVDEYMEKTKAPGSEFTYQQLLEQGSNNVKSTEIDKELHSDYSLQKGRVDEVAIVFMQISAPSTGEAASKVLIGGATSLIGTAAVTKSATFGKLNILRPVFTKVGAIYTIAIGMGIAANVEINSWGSRSLTNSYCGTFEGGNSKGCSVIEIVPYEAGSINQLCNVVEGQA